MTEEEFNNLKNKGFNRVPVFRKKLADLDTPLSIYLKIANEPNTYLFESVIDGERFGRYSFIGHSSYMVSLPTRTLCYVYHWRLQLVAELAWFHLAS